MENKTANMRSYINLEITENDRMYNINIPFNAPYAECYFILDSFKNCLLEMEKKAKEQQEAAKQAESTDAAIEPEIVNA